MTYTRNLSALRKWLPRTVVAGVLALVATLASEAWADSVSDLMNRARSALAKRDGIAAEADLRRIMVQGASKDAVAARMGEALIYQGERKKAREWLSAGQFAKGEEAWGFRMLGQLERIEGNLPAAGQAYDQALRFTPRDSQLWVDIGRLRYSGGEQLQAVQAAEQAVAFGPDNIRALEFRAQLVRDRFGLNAALPWFEAALAKAPDDVALLSEYAATLGELGRASEMLLVTRKMLALAPRHAQAFYLQAALAARAGRIDLARALLNRTGDQLRDVPAAMLLRGALELEAGNATFATEVLDRLARRQPANQRVQMLLARAMYEAEAYDDLFNRFATQAERPDAPAYLLVLLGRAHEERGDRAAASPLLDRAAAASIPPVMAMAEADPIAVLAGRWRDHPTSSVASVPYLRSLIGSRNMVGAEQVAERLRGARPGSGDALSLAGDVQLASGKAGAALDRYALAAQIRFPDSMLLRMTEAHERLNNRAANPALAQGYLAAYPGSRLAARLAGGYAALNGNWARSAAILGNLRTRGAGRDVRLLCDLSLAQLRSGDRLGALASARTAYRLQRSSPVAAQAYAMALIMNREQLGLADQLLIKSHRIAGSNPLLVEARQQLEAVRRR